MKQLDKNQIVAFYQSKREEHEGLLKQAKKRYFQLGTLRLATVVITFLIAYWIGFHPEVFWVIGAGISLFLLLVAKSQDARYQRQLQQTYLDLLDAELAAHQGDWSNLDAGTRYQNPRHPFSQDMDLFGERSFFQLVNRTVRKQGGDKLAHVLSQGFKEPALMNSVITDFSSSPDWLLQMVAEARAEAPLESKPSWDKAAQWSFQTKNAAALKWLLPIVAWTGIVTYALGITSGLFFSMSFFVVLGTIGAQLRRSNGIFLQALEMEQDLKSTLALLERLKDAPVKEASTKQIIDGYLGGKGCYPALVEMKQWMKRTEFRNNLLVGTVLNYLFAWDCWMYEKWNGWHEQHGKYLSAWQDELALLEVYVSGAIYRFNFPNTTFATFHHDGTYQISDLGHPFVAQDKMVPNSLSLSKANQFIILTGPNMAGKSTFLRSVGLALICANAGWPVMASQVDIPRVSLYSSMRTVDDLTDDRSYFFAELSRLRFIVDAIESDAKVFVILDEILKGTNSKDKEQGSAAFMRKLKQLGAHGIVATHDISLTDLGKSEGAFKNQFFDSIIETEQLRFDYQLRDGVCQNMNASFLLRQMKLTDESN